MNDRQRALPFEEAEGTHAERRNRIGLALLAVGGDLALRELMIRIFNVTKGGLPGLEFRATIEEIARAPWGLCCSAASARRKVRTAVALGWLHQSQTIKADGGDAANAYAINWTGIRASLDLGRRRPTIGGPPLQIDSPPLQIDSPPLQIDSAYKEYSLSIPALSSSSLPSADRDEWAQVVVELAKAGARAIPQTLADARRRGETASEALKAIATYNANLGLFRADAHGETVGALCWRLSHGEWPHGIKPVDPAAIEQSRRKAADLAERRKADSLRQEQDEQRRDADLEIRFGASLDRLADQEAEALATPFVASLPGFRRGDYHIPGDPLRRLLLDKMAAAVLAADEIRPQAESIAP